MIKNILHITNGEYFNNYLSDKTKEFSLPFSESTMDGEYCNKIFSDKFIKLRAKSLQIEEEIYIEKNKFIQEISKNSYSVIYLWFGKDTFCQTNLLTLLAYLEQINYKGNIFLNYIDDETFEILDKMCEENKIDKKIVEALRLSIKNNS